MEHATHAQLRLEQMEKRFGPGGPGVGPLSLVLDQGEVLRTDWAVEEEDGMLRVTLLAQCREQIGREVPLTQQTKESTPLDQGEEGAP